ncbi:unnamed protein product [Musa acuminata var. zebrina]
MHDSRGKQRGMHAISSLFTDFHSISKLNDDKKMAKETPFFCFIRDLPKKDEMESGPGIVEGGGGDGLGELLEVDAAVAVGVGLLDHAGELAGGEGVAELGHGVGELRGGDVPVAVAVEHLEQPAELLLGVGGFGSDELRGDEGHELGELDEAVGVGVGPVDQGFQLVVAGLEADGAEEGAQLQLGEAAVLVAVEGAEDFAKLPQLLVVQLHRILSGATIIAVAHLGSLLSPRTWELSSRSILSSSTGKYRSGGCVSFCPRSIPR